LYHLFTVDLSRVLQGKKETTEQAEQSAETIWVKEHQLGFINDPLVAQMYLRKEYYGL
jgi:hypothetical protein